MCYVLRTWTVILLKILGEDDTSTCQKHETETVRYWEKGNELRPQDGNMPLTMTNNWPLATQSHQKRINVTLSSTNRLKPTSILTPHIAQPGQTPSDAS